MQLVDMDNRWIYKGSVTTPPCARFVYWNVLSTVYPISARHLDLFKAQLNFGEDGKLAYRGNYREVQRIDDHGVVYIRRNETVEPGKYDDLKKGGLVAGIVIFSILIVILLICILSVSCCW